MARSNSNPLESLLEGVSNAVWFTWYAFSNGIRKLFSPADWDYREQAQRDIPKIPGFMGAAMRNGMQNIVEFVDVRNRGNDGPRRK